MVTTSSALYLVFLAAIAFERFFELGLSRRNAARARARGGIEVGQRHYRVMAALHTLFLVACGAEVVGLARPFPGALGYAALAVAMLAQALRYWAIRTLGDRWNVRIVFVPGDTPVTTGPYRYVRHPNYVAVVLELAVIPLVHGAWMTALVFTVANAVLLAVRIRAEEAALGPSYEAAFAARPRFFPGARHGLS